ncbi:MAG: hypothetical protein J6T99_06095 [Oscillospiraceae bacterium]|nr:hypothetical protein [Oscillospiraceae bacterium]
MDFVQFSELEGKHAFLSPSAYNWIFFENPEEDLLKKRVSFYAPIVGTTLHKFACDRIKYRLKYHSREKDSLKLELYRALPIDVVDTLDLDSLADNLEVYISDAIGYRMIPEQILYYSDQCWGTTDAISNFASIEKQKILRIHDLKTGTTPAHIEQLMIYAALFYLQYHKRPGEHKTELRIYQGGEVLVHEPEADEIVPIMDRIQSYDRILRRSIIQ